MKPIETDELLHVFDAHTGNAMKIIEGEEELYSKEELLGIIAEALSEMKSFRDNWPLPIVEEIDGWHNTQ